VAIGNEKGKRVAVTIPAGDTVELIADPNRENEEMVDVLWEGRTATKYVVDLKQRGIETQSHRAVSDWLPAETR